MKFEKLITALLISTFTTSCQTTQQVPQQVDQSQQSTTPTVEAPTPVVTTSIAQNALPQVVSVGDGDTLRVRLQGKIITIRLGCIDAPETAQTPWGEQSAKRLQQLLPAGQAVQIREIDRDRYGRTVAELYLGNQSVNLMMVKEGQAVVYPQYLSGCSETKEQYLQAETQAKAQKLGFWNQASPVMPWDFRSGKRRASQPSTSTNPQAKPTEPNRQIPTPATANLPACTRTDCDCKDFQTQAEAKRVLDAFPNDPFDLDRDKDGIPCESLR
jgi:micrococcal nuclease